MTMKAYTGEAFVAFVDIAGFKKMLHKGIKVAVDAIDKFYQIGYELLDDYGNYGDVKIQGLLVSDCAILFSYRDNDSVDKQKILEQLLRIVKIYNIKMLELGYILTTSIAYGDFSYKGKHEFYGISKQPITGNAYLKAYLDSENQVNKLKPGFCRIVCEDSNGKLDQELNDIVSNIDVSYIIDKKLTRNRRYFYWNLNDENEIENFTKNIKKLNTKYNKEITKFVDMRKDEMYNQEKELLRTYIEE